LLGKTFIFICILLLSYNLLLANDNKTLEEEKFNRAYLSLYGYKDRIKKVIQKKHTIEKEFLSLNNIPISNQTQNIYLQSVCNINVHPQFPKSIIFPKNIKITEAEPFPSTIKAEIDKSGMNIIKIIPTNDLKKTVISVFYYEGNNKQKKYMTLVIDNYIDKANKKIPLYLITKLVRLERFHPNEVLKYYYDKYKKYPVDNSIITLEKNGKKQIYRFVRDSVNWDISIKNKTYRIVN